MYVHDVSDIFVDLLKLTNYLRLEGRKGWFGSEIAYVTCMVAWSWWRLYQYPFRVVHSSVFDVFRLLAPAQQGNKAGRHGYGFFFPPDLPLYTELNALLVILMVSERGGWRW